MAITHNLTTPIYNGEDAVLHFTVYQSDGTTIQNVSGWTTQWKLFKADVVVATIAGVIQVAASGTIDVTIPSATTASFTPGEYEYVFRRTDSSNKTVLAVGTVEFKETVAWS